MIYIKKGKEPDSLTAYKKTNFAYFDGCNKLDIRQNLLREQGNLCAYCMRRISEDKMKIEHWYPEDRLSDIERLEYKNMLGCCLGHRDGFSGNTDTCDTKKGNTIIKINPQDKTLVDQIKYHTGTGEIYSDDAEINNDLSETLNLNGPEHYLKENRKAALDSMIGKISELQKNGHWNKSMILKMIDKYSQPDEEGNKREYIGILLWYLNKKLR